MLDIFGWKFQFFASYTENLCIRYSRTFRTSTFHHQRFSSLFRNSQSRIFPLSNSIFCPLATKINFPHRNTDRPMWNKRRTIRNTTCKTTFKKKQVTKKHDTDNVKIFFLVVFVKIILFCLTICKDWKIYFIAVFFVRSGKMCYWPLLLSFNLRILNIECTT